MEIEKLETHILKEKAFEINKKRFFVVWDAYIYGLINENEYRQGLIEIITN